MTPEPTMTTIFLALGSFLFCVTIGAIVAQILISVLEYFFNNPKDKP